MTLARRKYHCTKRGIVAEQTAKVCLSLSVFVARAFRQSWRTRAGSPVIERIRVIGIQFSSYTGEKYPSTY